MRGTQEVEPGVGAAPLSAEAADDDAISAADRLRGLGSAGGSVVGRLTATGLADGLGRYVELVVDIIHLLLGHGGLDDLGLCPK